MEREFTVGSVLSQSFSVFGRNFLALFFIAFLLYVPIMVLMSQEYTEGADPEAYSVSGMIALLLTLPVMLILQGTMMHGVYESLNGRPFDPQRSLMTGLRRFGPLLAVSLVAGLLTAIASIFLVVPGIIVNCMFWVAVPATVVERLGVGDALERSRALTSGFRLRIFGLTIVAGLVAVVLYGIQFVGLRALAGTGLVAAVFEGAGDAVSMAFSCVVTAVGYYRLRMKVEGLDLHQLTSVFD